MNCSSKCIATVLAVVCLLFALPGWAAPVAVTNPGFEDITGENVVNEFTFGELNGWDLYDPNDVTSQGDGPTYFIGTLTPFEPDPIGNPGVFANFPAGAPEGQRVGIAFNFDGSEGHEYGFYQELAATLQPYTTYTLEVGIGNIDSATAMSGQFFPLEGFTGYRVELQAGGMMLEEDDNTLAGLIPDGEFATSTVTFTTGASHPQMNESLGILLVHLNEEDPNYTNSDQEVDFDDVRLDASPAIDGDFDFSGNVDGLDFLEWQSGFPSLYTTGDLALWENNYGFVSNFAADQVVPEPSTFAIFLSLVVALQLRTKKGRPVGDRSPKLHTCGTGGSRVPPLSLGRSAL